MIITKKQLKKAIERSEFLPPSMKEYYFHAILSTSRLMWETELIKKEQMYKEWFDIIDEVRRPETAGHIKTHNTDHAV